MLSPTRILQKMAFAAALLPLVACGDDAVGTTGSPSSSASGSTSGQGGAGGAGGEGGGVVVDPLELAVRGTDWAVLPEAPSVGGGAKQDDIFFVDAQNGFLASGPTGQIYATTDGGATWDSVLSSDNTYFRSVLFTSPQRGFAGNIGAGLSPSIDDATVVYETSDGGATWSPVTAVTGSAAAGICNFTVAGSAIFGIGRANGPAHLLRSDDGGASWVSKDLSDTFAMAIDGRFTSETDGIVIGMGATGQRCTVARTTDAGDTFETVFEADASGSLCWKVDFPSEMVGYVAILQTANGPGAFAKTTDGGATWVELPLPDDGSGDEYPALAVGFISDEIGWMASESPALPVYRTFDGGVTWEVDPALKGPINRFRFVDADTAFAVGAKVWKLDLSGAN